MGRRQCAVMRGGADNVAEGRAPRGRPAQGLPPPSPHSQAVPAVADSGKITLPSVLRCPEPRAPGLSRRAHAEYGYAVPVAPAAADGRPCCRRRLGRPAGSCGRRGHAARHTARPQDVRRLPRLLFTTQYSLLTYYCSLLTAWYLLLLTELYRCAADRAYSASSNRVALRRPQGSGRTRTKPESRQDLGMMLPPAPAPERRGGSPKLRSSSVQQQIRVQRAVQQLTPVVDKRRASRPLPEGLPPSLDTRPGSASSLGLALEAAPSPMRRLDSGSLDKRTSSLSSSGRSSRHERPSSPPPSPPAEAPPEQPQPAGRMEERLSRAFAREEAHAFQRASLAASLDAGSRAAENSAATRNWMGAGAKELVSAAVASASSDTAEAEMSPELKEKEEARELDLTGKGVVRVRLHGAHDLKPSDDPHREDRPWLGKKDLSDPYCTLGLHETEHRGTACHKTKPSPDPDH